jgi:hypothetical protein
MPAYLDWSDTAITFDRDNHPARVPHLGQYPLVVDPIIANTCLSKVLMDGGSRLNILYADTLDLIGIGRSQLRSSGAPFHGVVPGKRAMPVGRIDLPVTFGDPFNYHTKMLTFEVVGFRGTYHAILGCPCYAQFVVVPNYTYLKLKMPGPNGMITVGTTYRHAFECDIKCCEYAEALHESEALAAALEVSSPEEPDPKWSVGTFEPAVEVKEVSLDPGSLDDKVVRISTTLNPK